MRSCPPLATPRHSREETEARRGKEMGHPGRRGTRAELIRTLEPDCLGSNASSALSELCGLQQGSDFSGPQLSLTWG